MPKGYVFCEIEITDPETYRNEYMSRSSPAVERFGGHFLVRGGKPIVLEGDRSPKRVVIVEFDSPETARAFYESKVYQEAAKWRCKAARTHYYLIEGAQ
jgi:uncharacterized protein (DUF1330 family)